VKLVRSLRRFVDEIDIVQLPQGFQIAVPRWMLDPATCSQLPQEAKPRVAVSALLRLAELVQSHRLPENDGTAPSGTSQPTKGEHVSRTELSLSASSTAASQKDTVGKASRTSTHSLPASVDPDAAASRAQPSSGKEQP